MFFENYTEKLWGRHPRDISADWGSQRVKGLSITVIIKETLPYKLYWAVRKENLEDLDQYPKELNILRRDGFKFHKAVATSKIIIDNSIIYPV